MQTFLRLILPNTLPGLGQAQLCRGRHTEGTIGKSKRTPGPHRERAWAAARSDLLLSQPDVLKLSIHPVAGHGLVVTYTRRPHFETCRPEAGNPPGFLEDLFLHLFDELDALLLIQLDFLLVEQHIRRWLTKAAPVAGRFGDEFGQELIGV